MGRKFLRFLIRLILPLVARVDVRGYENIPETGGFVIAANHLGRLDSAVLFYAFDSDKIIMPVAEKYKRHWLYGPMVRMAGGFFIDRFNPDFSAVRTVVNRLRGGEVLVIAPEGTRSKTEALQEGKPGVAFFAIKAGVPILPVGATGTEDRLIRENIKKFKRTQIIVRAGKVFTLESAKGKDREEQLRHQTDEIMCQIGALIPEKYRGVYADHPRLKELLGGQE